MKEFIEDLRCLLEEAEECGDLEDRMGLAMLVAEQEELFASGAPHVWQECSNCHGSGKHKRYDDEWQCDDCFCLGGKYVARG
jgi:hypothetical protein